MQRSPCPGLLLPVAPGPCSAALPLPPGCWGQLLSPHAGSVSRAQCTGPGPGWAPASCGCRACAERGRSGSSCAICGSEKWPIPVQMPRGSAGGSLLAWGAPITALKYPGWGLLVEDLRGSRVQ